MNTTPPARDADRPTSWAARLHRALMPDYNRQATLYWWAVVAIGTAIVLHALAGVWVLPPSDTTQIAIGIALAMLAGFFPVRVPGSINSFAAGEIFIFLLLLLHGPEAATLAAAGEALVSSWRTSKRWTSRIASPTIAALAMAVASTLLEAALVRQASIGWTNAGVLIISTMTCALVYFGCNTLLVTTLPRLKRNERFTLSGLIGLFGWVGIAYMGSAAIAALLHLTYQQSGIGVLMAVLPIIAMMLATLHYFFRQQEADAAARTTTAAAAAREAELAQREAAAAARHMGELQASERRFHSAFTHASIGMALLSFDGTILQANPAMRALVGPGDTAMPGRHLDDFIWSDDLAAMSEQLRRLKARQVEDVTLELRCRSSNGRPVWVEAHCSFFSEPDSNEPCLILQAHDISARRDAEAGLQHLAFHDSLTGLPNRRRFQEHLSDAVQRAQADPLQSFAVMFIDFDRFKLINDSLGHSAGDEFLIQVSRSIQDHLRLGDIVARLGGDEFALLIQRPEDTQVVIALAERLLQTLRRPMMVAGTELISSASIGITLSSIGYTAPEQVLRDADIAMYKAKASGKARYALFDVGLHTDISRRMRLEGELRRALDAGQLGVAYQPLFNLDSGAVTGFEALARWQHPEFGTVEPDVFVPIAEESGLILQLTEFVLHRACHELARWQQSNPTFANLTMQVNISGRDIVNPGFIGRVTHALVEARLQPQQLILELTENALMSRIDGALGRLGELRQLGVGLSVDDFGTGYSSLARLSSLPIDSLKIDRSFVRDMRFDTKESTVVRAIIHLGNSLGKAVIAEGIETRSQFSQLHEMGCQFGQGFHLSRPLDAEAVDALLLGIMARSALEGRRDRRFAPHSAFH